MEIVDMTFSVAKLWAILVAAHVVLCVVCIIKEWRTQREIWESLRLSQVEAERQQQIADGRRHLFDEP
jgi:hypothetical protein